MSERRANVMHPPVQVLGPKVLLLTGLAVDALAYAVDVAQRARIRNGMRPSRDLAILAEAAVGQTDVTTPDTNEAVQEWITTKEAAEMLECSTRQARRLAPGLGGRFAGGCWMVDRLAVVEHIGGRQP